MSLSERPIKFDNEGIYDAFARARVSGPFTLWDSNLLGDARPLFWDDAETSGSGTGSIYTQAYSSVALSVGEETAGTRVRQTRNRFNYQPGKSQLALISFTMGEAVAGVTKRIGLFDGSNGLFLQQDGNGLSFVRRSSRSGEVVDTVVPESQWRAKSPEPIPVIDPTKSQILVIDFEWLGVGSARMGFVVDGNIHYRHVFQHANVSAGVYMTTPNLPVRYEISNDGTGAAASMECVCSTVMSEGGQDTTGTTFAITTVPTHVDANSANTDYAIIGVKLRTGFLDTVTRIKKVELLNEGNDDFYWSLKLNPTVAGTFTYADLPNTPIQFATGATANTVTGGFTLSAGLSTSSSVAQDVVDTLRYLGSAIDGTQDEIVLTCTPLSTNADIHGTMTLEFS